MANDEYPGNKKQYGREAGRSGQGFSIRCRLTGATTAVNEACRGVVDREVAVTIPITVTVTITISISVGVTIGPAVTFSVAVAIGIAVAVSIAIAIGITVTIAIDVAIYVTIDIDITVGIDIGVTISRADIALVYLVVAVVIAEIAFFRGVGVDGDLSIIAIAATRHEPVAVPISLVVGDDVVAVVVGAVALFGIVAGVVRA